MRYLIQHKLGEVDLCCISSVVLLLLAHVLEILLPKVVVKDLVDTQIKDGNFLGGVQSEDTQANWQDHSIYLLLERFGEF